MRVVKEKKNQVPSCRVLPIREDIAIHFGLFGGSGNTLK
jgi:hypothetical protein